MLKPHDFFRQFEDTEQSDRFQMIETPVEATSVFTIFKQLQQVRAQKKYFEDREAHLLNLASLGFQQLERKNADSKKPQ